MADPLSMSASYVETLSEPQTAQVMAAWVHAKRVELPQALASSRSKTHSRLAKKALYQLRSVGVSTPERASVEPEVQPSVTAPAEVDAFPAVMTSVIGNGERGLLFARPVRGGGCEIYESVVQDEKGIMSLERGEAPRAFYRERIKQLRKGPNRVLFVPFERARRELARAMSRNSLGLVPLTLEAQGVLAKLGVVADDAPLPIDALAPGDAALLERSGVLHEAPEVVSWLPTDTDLAELAQRLGDEATASPERKAEIAREVSHRFATPAIRALYANRLWLMAELFEGTDRAELAALARAEARHLAHDTKASKFLEQLFAKVPAEKGAGNFSGVVDKSTSLEK